MAPALLLFSSLIPLASAGEDQVTTDQSIDAFNEMEDGQAGPPGVLEERVWLNYGYVPAEGPTPSDTFELSYTPNSKSNFVSHMEFDVAQYFEHDDVDNTTAIEFGIVNRWVKDGGKKSAVPSIGTLTEYWLRTPFVIQGDAFAPGATQGDHVGETLTIAKYLGPGSLYLNGSVERRLFQSEICVTDQDVAIQPGDAPDQNGAAAPNYDGCDYWAPWTFAVKVGYKAQVIPEKFDLIFDFVHETNEFTTQVASPTLPGPEKHHAYEMAEVSTMIHAGEHFTFGPGALFGLTPGFEETPTYEAGLFFLHE